MNEFGEIEVKAHGDSSESPVEMYAANSRGSNREGKQKAETEDQCFMLTDKEGEGRGNAKTFGIFDGAGGIENGRAAAKAAQKTVMDEIKNNPDLTNPEEVKHLLVNAINKAHSAAKETGGMTTGSIGYIVENPITKGKTLVIAHVGDSAIFIVRNGKVRQITENDDLESVGRGNILTQGLGHGEINPHIYTVDLMEGDRILAATDGVTDGISKEKIEEILSKNNRPENALEELVRAGQEEYYKKGGRTDDATAILIDFKSTKDTHDKNYGKEAEPNSNQQQGDLPEEDEGKLGIIDRAIFAILESDKHIYDCWGNKREMLDSMKRRARARARARNSEHSTSKENPGKNEDEIFTVGTMIKVRRTDGRLQDDWFVTGRDEEGNVLVSSPRDEYKRISHEALQNENPQIFEVNNFDDLHYAINQLPKEMIAGSDHKWSKEEIINLISQVRTGGKEIEFITRKHGIRQKVRDLIATESARNNPSA